MTGDAALAGAAAARSAVPFGAAAGAGAVLWFAILNGIAIFRAGGVFEYPLDDVYIHLAMADSIAAGGYGVNPGEYASASSSPLYPFLLAPFTGTGAIRLVPLVLNLAALAAAAWAWGVLLARAGFGAMPRLGLALAALGPVALNMAGVAFLGMEHALHAALSLAVLLGLVRFAEDGRIGPLLALGIVLGPLVRLEGLAVSLAACLPLLLAGRVRAALALGLGAGLPVLAFSGFLSAHGIGPLPNSVMAKLASTVVPGSGGLDWVLARLIVKLAYPAGALIAGAALVLLAVSAMAPPPLRRALGPVVLAGALVAFAHLLFGRMGWGHRYEHYAVVFTVAAAVYALGRATVAGHARPMRLAPVLPLALLAVPLAFYGPALATDGTASPRAIHLQQAQMARFARDHVAAPVAVNDIGRVAWRNPNHVLDLWGLASRAALEARRAGGPPAWADTLAARHGADLAMIYDHWLAPAVGPDWVRLGELWMEGKRGFAAGPMVAFYATRPGAAEPLRAQLAAFAPSLPQGARFVFDGAPR
ncbi:hypothetical protein [Rhodovulum marinum]|uniref:4-amino-4-deoxy-L-arabinose transferase-like glycosyltransferase n=1 Tax=Rhodovulum marinum TaxID=320662 RepID=A0A4R2Q7Z4_9RHOB|nr:hypothetical protein [Rhodovulum marinum]TCP44048.1 hypothetical protein EV662_101134 [Rhodovulum marinum]